MAFANSHLYLRISGHFGASATISDKWSSGLRLAIVGAEVPFSIPGLQTFCDAALAAVKTFHASGSTYVGTNTFLDDVSVARVGLDGKYNPADQMTTHSPTSPHAGTGTPYLPWNSAAVISLRTDYPRGYASNGRFYYPFIAQGMVPTTGRLSGTTVDQRVAAAKTLFEAINAAATAYAANMKIAVCSARGGRTAICHTIRSDERVDSIERRENQQPAIWHSATIAGA